MESDHARARSWPLQICCDPNDWPSIAAKRQGRVLLDILVRTPVQHRQLEPRLFHSIRVLMLARALVNYTFHFSSFLFSS